MLFRALYTVLLYLVSPLILFLLYRKKGYQKRWRELLGYSPPLKNKRPLWVHAVSVGEVVAATPLLQELKRQYPDLPLLLTTTTRTGADQALSLANCVEHRYAPVDFPGSVTRFLNKTSPYALLLMERELWPNLLAQCDKRHLPVMVLNARLSQRSYRRYQRFSGLFCYMHPHLQRILCQYKQDADRFRALGVPESKLLITGPLKCAYHLQREDKVRARALRQTLGERPIWVAASTHKGEDTQLIEAHHRLLQTLPHALLIVVPRHPERFSSVAALLKKEPLCTARRSLNQEITDGTQVYLADTMGELSLLYGICDIAFVGGSLVPRGGHNLLEPAAQALPCLTGPHFFHFDDIVRQLVECKGARIVHTSQELTNTLVHLFAHPKERIAMGEAARGVVVAGRGALHKTINQIEADLAHTLS